MLLGGEHFEEDAHFRWHQRTSTILNNRSTDAIYRYPPRRTLTFEKEVRMGPETQGFLQNCWYVAAWDHELADRNIARMYVPGIFFMETLFSPAGAGAEKGNLEGAKQYRNCQFFTPSRGSRRCSTPIPTSGCTVSWPTHPSRTSAARSAA
jgi:hypothetical protein